MYSQLVYNYYPGSTDQTVKFRNLKTFVLIGSAGLEVLASAFHIPFHFVQVNFGN